MHICNKNNFCKRESGCNSDIRIIIEKLVIKKKKKTWIEINLCPFMSRAIIFINVQRNCSLKPTINTKEKYKSHPVVLPNSKTTSNNNCIKYLLAYFFNNYFVRILES